MVRKIVLVIGLVIVLAASLGMAEKSAETQPLQRMIVKVETITCGGCFYTINNGLKDLDGFSGMGANLFRKLIAVDFAQPLTPEKISAKLESVGYPGSVESVEPVKEKESFAYLQSKQRSFQSCGGCSGPGLKNNRSTAQVPTGGSCCSLPSSDSPVGQPTENL